MASRSFTGSSATMNQVTMAANFENTLKRVNNMIKKDSAYSVWIRMVIGKGSNQIVFDSSSTNKEENIVMSLDYEKSGVGSANQFTFKVAFDLFNYGQQTKGAVEQLDELLYNAMNISGLGSNISESNILNCKFQYGYNILGDTQIVSPLYEGMITDIVPSVDYTNGKTYYTISGSSFVINTSTGQGYNFSAIGNVETGEGGWNGMDLILWILWYYHGNNSTVDMIWDKGYKNNLENHSTDWYGDLVDKFNIDIPEDLRNSASNVCMEAVSGVTAIDYCKMVLDKVKNTADPRYNAEKGDYNLKDGENPPKYILYMTDSGGSGRATIHIAYIGTPSDYTAAGVKTINFPFEWFNRTNNIVLKWNPEVNLISYLIARGQAKNKSIIEGLRDKAQQNVENAQDTIKNTVIPKPIYGPVQNPEATNASFAEKFKKTMETLSSAAKMLASNQALIEDYDTQLSGLQDENIEYYNSEITLVGIPSDIPLNVLLKIKPKILESVSRTQGTYYITGSSDSISTSGLFTTTIKIFRCTNY